MAPDANDTLKDIEKAIDKILIRFVLIMGTILAIIVSSILILSGLSYSAEQSGKIIYRKNCLACHKADGRGIPRYDLGKLFIIFRSGDLTQSNLSEKGMINVTSNGKKTMPPFRTRLSKEEIKTVVEYIKKNFRSNKK